jgi:ribosomal protein L37E
MPEATGRLCAACGSPQVTVVPRGFAGKTDTSDQYLLCQRCGQKTYEIVSVTQRDLRLYQYAVNHRYERDGITYRIRRVLKVGFDEFLLYLQADPPAREEVERPTSAVENGTS